MPERTKPTYMPLLGIPARAESDCQRCGEVIRKGDRICYRRGWAIHVRCQSGGDDE